MLHEALKLMRIFSQLTQTELSLKLGISKSYLSEIEAGKKKPPLGLINKYGSAFDIPPSQILNFSEQVESQRADEKIRMFSAKKILQFMKWVAKHDNSDINAAS